MPSTRRHAVTGAVAIALIISIFVWREKSPPPGPVPPATAPAIAAALPPKSPLRPAVVRSSVTNAAVQRAIAAATLPQEPGASLPPLPPLRGGSWNSSEAPAKFLAFADWVEKFRAGTAAMADGEQLATERRGAMAQLIQSDPETALQLAVPTSVRRALPESITALLETPLDGRGDLTLIAALPEPGTAPVRPANSRFVTLGGETYNAFVSGRRLGQPTRRNIPLHGIVLDGNAAISQSPVRVLEVSEATEVKATLPADPICSISGLDTTANNEEVALETGGEVVILCSRDHALRLAAQLQAAEDSLPPGTSFDASGGVITDVAQNGSRSILLIRVDFSDYPGGSITDTEGTNVITSLVNTFSNWSYGRLIIDPAGGGSDVTPVLRMPRSNAEYNGNDGLLRSDAWAAATNAGFPPSAYDLDATCFAGNTPNWGYGGLAFVGGRGTWLHTTGASSTAGIGTHEFGHNFGLNHANFYNAPSYTVTFPGGSNDEYGNPWDTMGSASTNNAYGASQKKYLGWLTNGGGLTEWIAVSNNITTNRIYAHDELQSPGLVKGLRITRDPNLNNDKEFYWAEYRTTKANKALDNGVVLNWAGNGNERPELLDTTPSSDPNSTTDKDDSALVIGRTFTDTNYNIHITPIAKGVSTNSWIDVVVNYGPFPGNNDPTVDVTAPATNAATSVSLSFTATASDPDGDTLAYSWKFDDGDYSTSNSPNVTHAWTSAGEYRVQCTVSDMKGGVAQKSITVRIGNPTVYTISGQTFLHGVPVGGVRVYTDATNFCYSDSDGFYSLVGLKATNWNVSAFYESHAGVRLGFANPVVVGPNTNNINFQFGIPLMGGLVSRSMNMNATNTPMFFWTFDWETAQPNVVVDAFSGNTNLMPDSGFAFSSTGTNRILTLTPATNVSGTVTNFVTATDTNGFTVTNSFVLTINAAPALTTTAVTSPEDTAVDVDLWARTSDGTTDSNVLYTVSAALNGTVSLVSNRYAHFLPATNFFGGALFTFSATDKGFDPNLLMYYDFEPADVTSDSKSSDRSGNLRDGTLDKDGTGAFAYETNAGPPALFPFSLASLNLSDNGNSNSARLYRTVPSGEYNFNNADWTFACWFRRDASTNDDLLFHLGKGDASGNDGQELFLYLASGNNSVRLRHYNSTNLLDLNISTPATALTSEWHHVAVTFDRTNTSKGDFKLYLDGTLAASSNGISLSMAQTNLVFGGHDDTNNTSRWFNGGLDEVAVWKAALASNDIAFLTSHTVAHFGGLTRSTNISLTFTNVNDPPTLSSIGNFLIPEDTFTGNIAFTVGDVETPVSNLLVTASSSNTNLLPNLPANMILGGSNASRTIKLVPATNQNGVVVITVSVSDGTVITSTNFQLTVSPVNDPPVLLSLPAKTIHAGMLLSFTLPATDPDTNDVLTFTLPSPPSGAVVNPSSGLVTWVPTDAQVGGYQLLGRVADNGAPNYSATNLYSITVVAKPNAQTVELLANGDYVITWNSIPGQVYRVQYCDDLLSTNWFNLPGDVTATGPTASKTNSIGALLQRFYKVMPLP